MAEIRWNSKPDLSGGWLDSGWSCDEWVLWHKALLKHYGNTDIANKLFIQKFLEQGNWDTQYNFCKYNSGFVNHFRRYGLDVGHAFSKIVVGADNIASKAVKTAESVADSASKGITSTGKVLKLLPILIAVVVLVIGFKMYKKGAFKL